MVPDRGSLSIVIPNKTQPRGVRCQFPLDQIRRRASLYTDIDPCLCVQGVHQKLKAYVPFVPLES